MSGEDTIREDVLDGDDKDQLIEGNQGPSDRDEAVEDIVANARKARQKEFGEEGDSVGENLQVYGEEDDLGETDDSLEEDKPYEPEMVEVVVNGQKKQVLKSKVDAAGGLETYQKNVAADEKLRLAAEEARKNAEEADRLRRDREEFDKQRADNLKASEEKNDQLSDEDADEIDDLSDDEITKMLYSGEKDEAKKAVRVLRGAKKEGSQSNKALTPEQTKEIEDRASAQAEWNIEKRLANEHFESEYADIKTDPVQFDYCNSYTAMLVKEHPEKGPRAIIIEAAEATRKKYAVNNDKGKSEDELEAARIEAEKETRIEKKRATDSVQAKDAKQPKKPVQKRLTPSQVVARAQETRSGYQS